MVHRRACILPFVVFHLLIFFFGFGLRGETIDVHSIQRTHDAVVLRGEACPLFLGKPVGEIRVYRYVSDAEAWEPIPFQVDELDGGNSYFGPKNGILDLNDEIVFLAKDLGDGVPATVWVDDEEAEGHVRYQITAEDPLLPGQEGWAYVYCSSTLPRSTDSYIQYFTENDSVDTETYAVVHGSSGFQGFVLLKPSVGGDGIDFLDRQKLRLKIKITEYNLNKEVTLKEEMNEDVEIFLGLSVHFRVRRKAVDTASGYVVRLHRNVTLEARVSGSVLGNSIDIQYDFQFPTTFYPTWVAWKTGTLEVPDPAEFDVTEMRFSTDLDVDSYGMIFHNDYNPPVRINGIDSEFDNDFDWYGQNWYLIVADPTYGGAVLQNASIVTLMQVAGPPLGNAQVLYFKDNDSPDGGDTGDRRSYGDTGIRITGNAISGMLDYTSVSYYLPENLEPSQAEEIVTEHTNPLQVTSRGERLIYPLIVEVSPPEGGRVVADPPADSAFADSLIVLTAEANAGYGFWGWSGDVEGKESPVSFVMDGPKQVTARFALLRDITIRTDPEGLDLSVGGETYPSPWTFTWMEGDAHSVCVDSLEGGDDGVRFLFSSWSDGEERWHEYAVPAQDDTLTARFMTEYYLTTAVRPEGTGTVVPAPPGGWFGQDTVVTVRATPVDWYAFSHWSEDLSGWRNPDSILMSGPKSVVAEFDLSVPTVAAPDTFFAEDDTLRMDFQDVLGWVADDLTGDGTLVVDVLGGSHVDAVVDTDREQVKVYSRVSDWNGVDTVVVTVTTPLGAVGRDSMFVTVNSVPDPPGPFALIAPSGGVVLTEWPGTLDFLWETSDDPDAGDVVTYVFELDTTSRFDSEGRIHVGDLSGTTYSLAWPDSFGNCVYYWRVKATDGYGPPTVCDEGFLTLELATGVEGDGRVEVPTSFVLEQNYPNPFNAETAIRFGVPSSTRVLLVVYNSFGQRVKTLVDGRVGEGYHTVKWDGVDHGGRRVATGLYFVLFRTESLRAVKKVMLLR